jgi:antitoxin component YwqK of YwqJK toxin-antitoxin module
MAKKTIEIRPRLSRIDFILCHGSDFFEALFQCIALELGTGRQRTSRWAKLNPYQQGVYAWSPFCGDVQNGGVTQYFFNHSDACVPSLEALLNEAGCRPLAALVEQATALYHEHKKAFAVENPFGDHGLFVQMAELAKLDRPILRQLEPSGKRLEKWLRAHMDQVAVGDDGDPIDPKFSGMIETFWANGQVMDRAVLERGKLSGGYFRYKEDGTLEHSAFYKDAEVATDYWASGQAKRKTSKRGKLTVVEWFYPSGALQKRFVCDRSDNPVEPVLFWHENGQLAEEVHVKEGKKFGPWRKFFADGSLRLEAQHGENYQLVINNAWNDQGWQTVKDGQGTYFDDGSRIVDRDRLVYRGLNTSTTELRDGIMHGVHTDWHDGVLWATCEYVKGKPHGVNTYYYDNGRPEKKITHRNGEAMKTEKFPRFDDPRPAVLLVVLAGPDQCFVEGYPMLDAYPVPRNLEEIQRGLAIPDFLEEIFERNKAGTVEDDNEDWSTFDAGISYQVVISAQGTIERAKWFACDGHSAHLVDVYAPKIRQLTFTPGQRRGRPARCPGVVQVCHTFVEAATGKR